MIKKQKLILVATQAKNTRENNHFIKSSEDLGVALIIFSLDNLDIRTNSSKIIIEIQNEKGILHNSIFNQFFSEQNSQINTGVIVFKNNENMCFKITISKEYFNNFDVKLLVRRLNDKIEPEVDRFESLFTMKFFHRLKKIHYLEHFGITTINSSRSIELSMDKFQTFQEITHLVFKRIILLKSSLISTIQGLESFYQENNSNIVLKPIFGSKGQGILRISELNHQAQEELIKNHLNSDLPYFAQPFIDNFSGVLRILVIRDHIIAGFNRIPNRKDEWILNFHTGAKIIPLSLEKNIKREIFDDAILISKQLGCSICGIDILVADGKYYFLESNAIPGIISMNFAPYYCGNEDSLFHSIIKSA